MASDNKRPKILCIGDSITHGHMLSSNWVEMLQARNRDFVFINIGHDGYTAKR